MWYRRYADVEKWLPRQAHNLEIGGSNPPIPTINTFIYSSMPSANGISVGRILQISPVSVRIVNISMNIMEVSHNGIAHHC